MTFDELNRACKAVRASQAVFNYFARIFKITLQPEYGYEAILEGRTFNLEFEDCIYFCSTNISLMAEEDETEFIVWGKSIGGSDGGSSDETLLEKVLSGTINAGIRSFGSPGTRTEKLSDKSYNHFYFQNVWGDSLDILSRKVVVIEDES